MKPRVVMLQRAIAHYRFPLFKLLSDRSAYDWTFYCGGHDIGTGLLSTQLHELKTSPIRIRHILGPIQYHSGVQLRGFDAFMLDLGWTLISNPRYLLAARFRGIATVGWSKGIPQDRDRAEGSAKRLYQKFILSLCDALVVYGQISKEYFTRLGFPEDRIFVAQNTIDTARIARETPASVTQKDALAARFAIGGRFVFGYLGSLIPRKKVEIIIEAYNLCRQRGQDAVLIIAGGGASEASVRAAAEASPFSRDIHLAGRIPVGEEGGYFQLFDAYLSYAEGGLGILEAMANGRTVVSTPEKYPETELLDDNKTALLSSDFTPQAFADRMLDATRRRCELAEIGLRAQQRLLADATLENMVGAIDRAGLAARHRRAPPA
ncbi:MAG: glycosyltransferase family 4 protein, partial [Chthoniobacteraceae bacterium]